MPPVVLIGTDFSEDAAAAFRHGRALAAELKAPSLLLHVVRPAEETGRLDPPARLWCQECGIAPEEVASRRGTPWIELTREAQLRDALFLVIGRHGRSGRQPVELGSTAARVSLAAPCPVLLVAATDPPIRLPLPIGS